MFTFKTNNFKEDAAAFSKYNFEKNYKNNVIITAVGGSLMFVLSLLLICLNESVGFSISMCATSIIILICAYVLSRTLTKGKATVEIEKVESVISVFNKDNFEVITKYVDGSESKGVQEYAQVLKIEENDNYIYIFINKFVAYVVKKSGIETGTVADFKKFLRKEKNFEIITREEKKSNKNRQRRRMENKNK